MSLYGFRTGKGLFPHHVPIHFLPGYDQINWNANCIKLLTNSSLTTTAMQNVFTHQQCHSKVKNKIRSPLIISESLSYWPTLCSFHFRLRREGKPSQETQWPQDYLLMQHKTQCLRQIHSNQGPRAMWTQYLKSSQSFSSTPSFKGRTASRSTQPSTHSFNIHLVQGGECLAHMPYKAQTPFGLGMPRH